MDNTAPIDSTNPKLIPGFCSLTKQQAFDISARHLLNTRKPGMSFDGKACSYDNSGCAAAPFLKPEERTHCYGGWLMVSGRERHLREFISALQTAHDSEVRGPDDTLVSHAEWFYRWKRNMRMIALAANLSLQVFYDAGEGF